jgi:hypothetical protein
MPTQDAIIYINADTIFLADPSLLWNHLHYFNKTQMIGATYVSETDMKNPYTSMNSNNSIPFVKPYGK